MAKEVDYPVETLVEDHHLGYHLDLLRCRRRPVLVVLPVYLYASAEASLVVVQLVVSTNLDGNVIIAEWTDRKSTNRLSTWYTFPRL